MAKERVKRREIDQVLGFADRCWGAEEVNAARIASRSNLVLSGILAVIGLKLFVTPGELRVIAHEASPCGEWLFWLLSGASFAGLMFALWVVLEIKIAKSGPPASANLVLRDPRPVLVDDQENAGEFVLGATLSAALDLYRRNRERTKAVGRAQIVFYCSTVLILFALVQYIALSYSSADKDHANEQQRQGQQEQA